MNTKTDIVDHLAGGNGQVIIQHLLGKTEFRGKARMYARVTLKPGCSIGCHPHNGETETYYILSGEGRYNDNGETRTVVPGDVTFTADGKSHGMENNGDTDLVFMALILLD